MKILEWARELAALADAAPKGPYKSGGIVVWQEDGDIICDLTSIAIRRLDLSADDIEALSCLIAAAPEMAKLLGKLAGKLEDLLPDSMGKCPPSRRYRNCPANIDSCPDCWQEWLER